MQASSSARVAEVKAWEEEILPCEHTLTLQQFETGHIPASGMFDTLHYRIVVPDIGQASLIARHAT